MHFPIAVITRETDGAKIPDEIESLLLRYSEMGDLSDPESSFAFVEDEYGEDINPDTGEYGWYVNPNMEYDWYEQGGHYEGWLHLASGSDTHSYRETSTMVSLVDSSRWNADFEAVVTPDGEWHAYSDEVDAFSDLANQHRDCAVTVVDCHI